MLPFAGIGSAECVDVEKPAPPCKRTKVSPAAPDEPSCQSFPPTVVQKACPFPGAVLGSTFSIPLSQLPAAYESEPWFKQLTLQPIVSSVCPTKPPPFKAYTVADGVLHVPRFYGYQHFGIPRRDVRVTGQPMSSDIQFQGRLCNTSPPQVAATEAVLRQLNLFGGAMLVLPCGFGKTVCSLWLAHTLHRQTLIIVHAEALAAQWKERINAFVPGARVGKIQQDVVEIDGCDFVVAMIQSLIKREYAPSILESFGTVILDEAHHVAAPMFSRALPKLPARYILGLSATPDRADGLGVALEWLLGPITFRAQRVYEEVRVRMITYTRGTEEELTNRRGDPLCSTMITNLGADFVRCQLIVELLKEQAAQGRNIIVLSDRLDQVTTLEQLLTQSAPDVTVAKVVGGTKAKDREAGFEAQVILSTYHYAAEGLDIPRLDTLVMATPRGNIEQSVGRILRPHPSKKEPLVLDIKDPFSLFDAMSWKRHRYYKSENYHVTLEVDVEEAAKEDLCFF